MTVDSVQNQEVSARVSVQKYGSLRKDIDGLVTEKDGLYEVDCGSGIIKVASSFRQQRHVSSDGEDIDEGDAIDGDDTGIVLWPASIHLARWLNTRDLGTDKTVLELGCGVGLTGLACAHMKSSEGENVFSKVLLTDQSIDAASGNWKCQNKKIQSRVSVEKLAWDKNLKWEERVDYVIAADILYNQESSVLEALAATIDAVLKEKSATKNGDISVVTTPTAYIAFEMRNNWFTQAEFTDLCEQRGLTIGSEQIAVAQGPQGNEYYVYWITR